MIYLLVLVRKTFLTDSLTMYSDKYLSKIHKIWRSCGDRRNHISKCMGVFLFPIDSVFDVTDSACEKGRYKHEISSNRLIFFFFFHLRKLSYRNIKLRYVLFDLVRRLASVNVTSG